MIRILFLINTLGGGGAERVLVNLVNHMDPMKFDITVETMFSDGVNARALKPHIKLISKKARSFRGMSKIYRFIPSRLLYNYFIKDDQYDILVAYMHGLPTKVIAGCRDKNKRKITWLHCGDAQKSTIFSYWPSVHQAVECYKSMDAIVGVSNTAVRSFEVISGIKESIHVIYNTNDCEAILSKAEEKVENPFKDKNLPLLCSVGRISPEKGYERLINAAKRLYSDGILFNLIIIGDGPLLDTLRSKVNSLGLEDKVKLIGFRENPYPYVKMSDVFICSSFFEGLSTAVSEAIILGKPVVSTNVSGAREILGENNEYGIVVENSEEGIYKGLYDMINNKDLLTHYCNKAKQRSSFFSTKKTVSEAERLFMSMIKSEQVQYDNL